MTSPVLLAATPEARAVAALRMHERLEGAGHVYDDAGQLLAETDYSLKDVEEMQGTPAVGGGLPVSAYRMRNVYGTLKPTIAGVLAPYVGVRLVLRLQDGRSLPFTVSKVMGKLRYLIQGLGPAD